MNQYVNRRRLMWVMVIAGIAGVVLTYVEAGLAFRMPYISLSPDERAVSEDWRMKYSYETTHWRTMFGDRFEITAFEPSLAVPLDQVSEHFDTVMPADASEKLASGHMFLGFSYGWPWRALRYRGWVTPTYSQQSYLEDSVAATGFLRGWEWDNRIPLGVMWPGMLGNLAIVIGAVSAVYLGLAWMRVQWRITRGLCCRCAYDMRGLEACPECGAGVKSEGAARLRCISASG